MKATLHIAWAASLQRPPEGTTEINVVRGGPEQLLAWLETQFGLNGPHVNHTDRVMAYHGRLKGQTGAFAKSYETDAWATASHLLARRDALLLAGWDRSGGPALVQDMANAEPMPPHVPGHPERLRAVIEAMDQGFVLPPHEVHMPDRAAWPHLWQRVLERLTLVHPGAPTPRGEGALQTMQENLLTDGEQQVAMDAAFTAATADSRMMAVQFLARWLAGRDATVHCEDGQTATLLDAALRANGVPTMGAVRETRAHPAMQVLPLTIGLLSEPVNPYILLDFLTLPLSPVRKMRFELARALEKQPGYGSDAWIDAVAKVVAEEPKMADKIATWLDHERVPIGAPIRTTLVQKRCGVVAQWATGWASTERKKGEPDAELVEALSEAAAQAKNLGELAAQLGSTISEAQLGRLLDEVRNEGARDHAFPAEAGGPRIVTRLADVQPTDTLVWLGVTTAGEARSPWTPHEQESLAADGIDVSLDARRRAAREANIRGICQARRMFVVELPEDGATHPLWLQMRSNLDAKVPRLEQLLDHVETRQVIPEDHHEAATIWDAQAPLPRPETVSATSLEDQLACPLKWALRHSLRIRPSTIASIPEGPRLMGTFAHELLEDVFLPGPPPEPDAAARSIGDAFDAKVSRNAAPLAVPRKLADRKKLRRHVVDSARALAQAMRAGGYEVVGLEMETAGQVDGAPLKSYIDCVVRGPDGEAIIDFKYGGEDKRRKELEGGRALQLATYAHARGARRGAYFILSNRKMVTPAAGPVEGTETHVPGPDLATTWQRFAQALLDAGAWMDSGLVPVRPLQKPEDWDRGTNVVLEMVEDKGTKQDKAKEDQTVCAYCDYDSLCGRRQLR